MKRILATLAALTLAACGAGASGGLPDDVKAADVAVHLRVAVAPQPALGVPTDKVVLIVLENHSLKQIKAGAPYTQSLADKYGQATQFKACAHPSKPNYACYFFGSKMGLTSDSSKRVSGQSVMGAAYAHGRTAKTMAESMGKDRCRHTNGSGYVEKHNGPEFAKDENAQCEKYNFSLDLYGVGDIANGKLGNIEFILPNQCSNAHDCSLKTWDAFLKRWMDRIFAGPDWLSGDTTIIITADEDDRKNGNIIPFIVINPNLSHKVVAQPLDWRHLNRLLTDVAHAPPMREGVNGAGLAAVFGLTVQ
jgi:hypothetical protein